MCNRDVILKKLANLLSEERLRHSIGVAEIAMALAKSHNINVSSAEIAGLLHDSAKEIPLEKYPHYGIDTKKIKKYDYYLKNSPKVIHGFASRQLAENMFDVKDENVLRAIESHTMGNENMTELDKIIFVADLIEPNRNCEFSKKEIKIIENIRNIAPKDLNIAVILSMEFILKFLIENRKFICEDTIIYWNNMQ